MATTLDTVQPDTIHRLPSVIARVGLSAATIWRMERRGEFPARVQLGRKAVGWIERDLVAWLADRKRGLGAVTVARPVSASPTRPAGPPVREPAAARPRGRRR